MRLSRAERWALVALLAVAFALRVGLATAFPTVYRPDEIFQTIEPAHRLVTGWGVVTWEWREGARSWLFPAMFVPPIALAEWLRWGPGGYMPMIAAELSLISLLSVVAAFALGRHYAGRAAGWLCAGLVAFWPDCVYFDAKPMAEIVSAHLIIAAMGMALLLPADGRRRKWLAAIGLLMGCAFAFRIHVAPLIALIGLWCLWRAGWRAFWPLLAGAAGPLALMGAVDWLTWGAPFISIWTYYQVNLVQGYIGSQGYVHPLFYVFGPTLMWGPAAIPVLALAPVGALSMPLAAAIIVVDIALHSLFAIKTISYIYAAIPLLLILSGMASVRLAEALGGRRGSVVVAVLWAVVPVVAVVQPIERRMWHFGKATPAMAKIIRDARDLCGVGIEGGYLLASYALMDRAVPLYLVADPSRESAVRVAANYMITRGPQAEAGKGDRLLCDDSICLFRRPGPCVPSPEDEINRVLVRHSRIEGR
jgi:hypothetical protein